MSNAFRKSLFRKSQECLARFHDRPVDFVLRGLVNLIFKIVKFFLFACFVMYFCHNYYDFYSAFCNKFEAFCNMFESIYYKFFVPSVQKPATSDISKEVIAETIVAVQSDNNLTRNLIISGSIVVVGVGLFGLGVLFIPGFQEVIVGTIIGVTTSGGFGGA